MSAIAEPSAWASAARAALELAGEPVALGGGRGDDGLRCLRAAFVVTRLDKRRVGVAERRLGGRERAAGMSAPAPASLDAVWPAAFAASCWRS